MTLSPAGRRNLDAIPSDEPQLQRAIHGILHGLGALHEARVGCLHWWSCIVYRNLCDV